MLLKNLPTGDFRVANTNTLVSKPPRAPNASPCAPNASPTWNIGRVWYTRVGFALGMYIYIACVNFIRAG